MLTVHYRMAQCCKSELSEGVTRSIDVVFRWISRQICFFDSWNVWVIIVTFKFFRLNSNLTLGKLSSQLIQRDFFFANLDLLSFHFVIWTLTSPVSFQSNWSDDKSCFIYTWWLKLFATMALIRWWDFQHASKKTQPYRNIYYLCYLMDVYLHDSCINVSPVLTRDRSSAQAIFAELPLFSTPYCFKFLFST